jgi:hypothetical protein
VIAIALIRSAMLDMMPASTSPDALPGIADTGVTEFLVTMKRESHWFFWLGIVLGAYVYMITPILTVHWPVPAFMLSRKLRETHAQRIVASPIYLVRQAVFLVRLSAGLCWGRDPKVRARFALEPYAADPGTYRST